MHRAPGYFHDMIFNKIVGRAGTVYFTKYIYPRIQPQEIKAKSFQHDILRHIIKKMRDTAYGKLYHFGDIYKDTSWYDRFRSHVPIGEYDDIVPYIQQAEKKPDILWPGQIRLFSASSGTTSAKKIIPVTPGAMASAGKAGQYMFAEWLYRAKGKEGAKGVAESDIWPFAGSVQHHDHIKTIADMSALLLIGRHKIFENRYALKTQILLEPDRERKRNLFLSCINPHRPVTMVGVTSRISDVLHFIQNHDPEKFDILKHQIKLIIGGGVDVAPFMHFFKELHIPYIGGYNASEGYFGYQDVVNYENDDGKAPYKILTNHGFFAEFLPFDEKHFTSTGDIKPGAQRATKSIWELTPGDTGKKFALVITENNGLCRYLIGDVLQIHSFTSYGSPRFTIAGRTRQSINLKGEELMETHVNEAIHALAREEDVHITNYTIAPDADQDPKRHEWIIELGKTTTKDIGYITGKIDKVLQHVNADYQAKRKSDMLLEMPKITIVPPGTFYARQQSKGRLGGQHKVPRLSQYRTHIQELLAMFK